MRIATFDRLVRLKLSLFSLCFTAAGGLLPFAMDGQKAGAVTWLWILVACISGRVAGMAFNGYVDRKIDEKNPRTQGRPVVQGEISPRMAAGIGIGGLVVFLAACSQINRAVMMASPVLAAVIAGYALTKRFTSLCHFVIGSLLMAAPVMAWLAVTGQWAWPPVLLGGVALCAIAGNDIIYGLQDYSFDRDNGIHSMAVRVGPVGAIMMARLLYSGAVICLAGAGWLAQIGWPYYLGVIGAMGAVWHYDRVLLRQGEEGIPQAFFRCNLVVAVMALVATLGGVAWRVWS